MAAGSVEVNEVGREQWEGDRGVRESLQNRIERELRSDQEEAVQTVEPGKVEQVIDEVVEWMVGQLMEDDGIEVQELEKGARRKFGRAELPAHLHWIVAGIKEGLEKGKEAGRRKDRRRRRDVRVQTECEGVSGVQSVGVRVQTDMTGVDLEKMERRAYEGIRESRKKSKFRTEGEVERMKVTITTEGIDKEVEVVLEEMDDMPDLVVVADCKEIEREFEEMELPVLMKEMEGEMYGKEELRVKVRLELEQEECGLGEMEEIELGWEEASEGDLDMAGGRFGELCEAVAMVELEGWKGKGEMGDDLLTGWVLPVVGNPDGHSSSL